MNNDEDEEDQIAVWYKMENQPSDRLDSQALIKTASGQNWLFAGAHRHHYAQHYINHRFLHQRHALQLQFQTLGASLKGKLDDVIGVVMHRTRRITGQDIRTGTRNILMSHTPLQMIEEIKN